MSEETTTGATLFDPVLKIEDVERMASAGSPHMVGHRMALKMLLHGSDWHLEQAASMENATQTAATSYRNIASTIRLAADAWRDQLLLMETAAPLADALAAALDPPGDDDVVN